MAKDPAFLFYPGDYIGGTMGMTFEEKGAYVDLLMMQFNRGHMDSHMINQLIGHLWDNIKGKFIQDENGLWYNERLDREKLKRQLYTQSRMNNILGSSKSSNKSSKKRAVHMDKHMTSHMENENINENINKDRTEKNSFAHQLFDYYNETVKTYNAFPSVLKFTKERADKCRARLKDVNFFETFKKALVKAKDTPFLCGTNDRGWKMNFDFLIANDSNVFKILVGEYDGGKKNYEGQW